tara:strand:+ start:1384 stop:2136 length:753 start_codon:yes stop_codon:yes gene_type:complete
MKDLTTKPTQEDLYKLKDDKNYYGDFGKLWLSNSDIIKLLNDPKSFRKPQEETKAMLEGRYFHTAILEVDKLEDFTILDLSSRNTKAYKEHFAEHQTMALLRHEQENILQAVSIMKSNIEMFDEIYNPANMFEVPMTKTIQGENWKGKADIVCVDKLIDLKTTSDISKFKYSARKYNYDSQAYIYQELFGLPLEFYVVDKTTLQLGIFKPTEEFLAGGKEKVEEATLVYQTYFKENSVADINQKIIHEIL